MEVIAKVWQTKRKYDVMTPKEFSLLEQIPLPCIEDTKSDYLEVRLGHPQLGMAHPRDTGLFVNMPKENLMLEWWGGGNFKHISHIYTNKHLDNEMAPIVPQGPM